MEVAPEMPSHEAIDSDRGGPGTAFARSASPHQTREEKPKPEAHRQIRHVKKSRNPNRIATSDT
jgi:hypothetical protein